MKIVQRFLIAFVAVSLVCGCASRRSQSSAAKPPTQAADVPKPDTTTQVPPYMQTLDYGSGGPVPPMEPGRRVNDQDCKQPIDITAGNLRCR